MTLREYSYNCGRIVRELCSGHDIQSAVSDDTILSLLRPFSATELEDDSPWRVLCDITGAGDGSEQLTEVAGVLAVQLLTLQRRSASLDTVQIMTQQLLGGDRILDLILKSPNTWRYGLASRVAQHGAGLLPDWGIRYKERLRQMQGGIPSQLDDDQVPCVDCKCDDLQFVVHAPVLLVPPRKSDQVLYDDLELIDQLSRKIPRHLKAELRGSQRRWDAEGEL
jgi:hypothetical protein